MKVCVYSLFVMSLCLKLSLVGDGCVGDEPQSDSHFQEDSPSVLSVAISDAISSDHCSGPRAVFTHISVVYHVSMVTAIPGWPHPTVHF